MLRIAIGYEQMAECIRNREQGLGSGNGAGRPFEQIEPATEWPDDDGAA